LITVDTGSQKVTAWDNGQIVFQAAASTGLLQTPTVTGNFRIYRKVLLQDMRGYSRVNGWYFHEDVPHVMYFYQSYALHGANWHNNFGTRMSNGCVNLSIAEAERFYHFADVGTRVVVY
jgi:lipoprotein-anchoring transpeptidase ErfK/SrfK